MYRFKRNWLCNQALEEKEKEKHYKKNKKKEKRKQGRNKKGEEEVSYRINESSSIRLAYKTNTTMANDIKYFVAALPRRGHAR